MHHHNMKSSLNCHYRRQRWGREGNEEGDNENITIFIYPELGHINDVLLHNKYPYCVCVCVCKLNAHEKTKWKNVTSPKLVNNS